MGERYMSPAEAAELVERAFKNGLEYATIVAVDNDDEARDQAWQVSKVRAELGARLKGGNAESPSLPVSAPVTAAAAGALTAAIIPVGQRLLSMGLMRSSRALQATIETIGTEVEEHLGRNGKE